MGPSVPRTAQRRNNNGTLMAPFDTALGTSASSCPACLHIFPAQHWHRLLAIHRTHTHRLATRWILVAPVRPWLFRGARVSHIFHWAPTTLHLLWHPRQVHLNAIIYLVTFIPCVVARRLSFTYCLTSYPNIPLPTLRSTHSKPSSSVPIPHPYTHPPPPPPHPSVRPPSQSQSPKIFSYIILAPINLYLPYLVIILRHSSKYRLSSSHKLLPAPSSTPPKEVSPAENHANLGHWRVACPCPI
jgi:hypothetical protein